MKKHSIVFAIATVVLMFVGFAGCDKKNTPPLSIIFSEETAVNIDMAALEAVKYESVTIKLINRSGTETLVLRTDLENHSTIIIPPGDEHHVNDLPKGKKFTITVDGYSREIKGTTPTHFD